MGGKREEPDLRAGVDRPHRPHRGGRGDLRPGQGELREAARHVLAEPRPDGEGPPVLRLRARSTVRRSSGTRRSRSASPRPRRRSGKSRSPSASRSSRRSPRRASSGRRRTTTRTTTRRTRLQYRFYVTGCGRYARLDSLWGSLQKVEATRLLLAQGRVFAFRALLADALGLLHRVLLFLGLRLGVSRGLVDLARLDEFLRALVVVLAAGIAAFSLDLVVGMPLRSCSSMTDLLKVSGLAGASRVPRTCACARCG